MECVTTACIIVYKQRKEHEYMWTGTYVKPIRLVIVECPRCAVVRTKITVTKKTRTGRDR